ncbi:hypothetical protein FN976_06210 [Caenimonas sedimenti]|uniref:O-antigen ligase-related domain-containing protein n=1 Tax=Caenimonas sedimenti TaxID=2596921 RepID=A0A562ZVF8_9BURK|nr:O-antigen ligase family protein [Caenimonas sedimenti]TWO72295.1 hypothetical protein FN976_06210 [Caenimonas sedimenti]
MNSLFFVFLLAGAVFKNDIADFALSEWYSDISWPPVVVLLKQSSYLWLTVAATITLRLLFKGSKFRIRRNDLALVLILTAMTAALRGGFYSIELGVKILIGAGLLAMIVLATNIMIARDGMLRYGDDLVRGLLWFSRIFIVLNFGMLLFGYGIVLGNPRFFGSAAHPNFLAVQLTVCAIVLFSAVYSDKLRRSWPNWLLIFASLYLLVATGSRTGLLMTSLGVGLYVLCRSRFKLAVLLWVAIALAIFLAAILSIVPADLLLSFDRGEVGLDTRSEAWGFLLGLIASEPIFGHGLVTFYSENSYLRGLANYGLVYFVPFVFVAVVSTIRLWKTARASEYKPIFTMMFCLHVSLLTGAMLEGYLIDLLSLPVFMYVITSTFIAGRSAGNSMRRSPMKSKDFGTVLHH